MELDSTINSDPSPSSVTADCIEEVVDVRDGNLVGLIANSMEEAFELYNSHAFAVGFSVRKGKHGHRIDGSISWKYYFCSKAGEKQISKNPTSYTRLNVRTNCPCFMKFSVDACGVWYVTEHKTEQNHDLCPLDSAHLLRSHRRVSKTHLTYLLELKKSGVGVADGVRILKNQSGGSPLVGFNTKDAYNAISKSNVFDGTDSNTLIEIFRNRQSNEKDFYFEFEVDSDSRLCSFFWRDGRMRDDYNLFGDLLVHDTTYRTNKYDMICGPFVGMNHHGKNVMFGCGFLMNERTGSFEWLFSAFLRSMGGKHPTTIMTDQSAAMAAAISKIFPMSRHRLCVWHIGENSKINIRSLRSQKGFVDLFNYILKYVETEAEFNFYWAKMVTDYDCKDNSWLRRLYEIRRKWCRAFNKDYFSGGILSSQRSESTNHAITRKLSKTDGLCDFYNMFVGVVHDWRSNENAEDVRCMQGKPSMVLDNANLLLHARDVYTIEMYSIFQEQYMRGVSCVQVLFSCEGSILTYHVWIEGKDVIRNVVIIDVRDLVISCTCKLFDEVGILCCHCLRILNIHCFSALPERYIKKRWCKDVVSVRVLDDHPAFDCSNKPMAGSLWRIQMNRNFQKLILACENNVEARLKCEEAFENAKRSVIDEVGSIYFDDHVDPLSIGVIQNPESCREKGKRNMRPKSVLEKKSKQAKGKRHRAQIAESQTKKAVEGLQNGISTVASGGYVVHPSGGSSQSLGFVVVSPNTSSILPPLPHLSGS